MYDIEFPRCEIKHYIEYIDGNITVVVTSSPAKKEKLIILRK